MTERHHHDEGELHFEQIHHHGTQFEDRDLGARGIIVFLVVLGITSILLCAMVWGYFAFEARHMRSTAEKIVGPQEVVTPSAEISAPEVRFPKPALQTDDVHDLHQLQEEEIQRLGTYGYIDQAGGVVHIPIDQAIDQLAKQGLPTRPQQGAQQGVAQFGNGTDTVPGAAGGVRPETN